ncbi:MAG: class I SAM-dependent methyltransferase family protein [Thermoplasmata archaeon]|nr:class I SAM-dependent methyltransferase family protein [Thermoplasmata archaeon]
MRTPFERIREALTLPGDLAALLPRRWELIGDVLLLKFDDRLSQHYAEIARAYASVLGAKTVLRDMGISGRFRTPSVEILIGTETVTWHRENGVVFRTDPARVMFSSGNIDERMRMATIARRGEFVVDMFAGIGYFIAPMAVHSGVGGRAYELNPVSHGLLLETLEANGVAGRVEALNADCLTAEESVADRVVMGYLTDTEMYLEKAFRILRPEGGVVHCHTACPVELIPERPLATAAAAARRAGGAHEVLLVREVKSYAPGVDHIVLDIAFRAHVPRDP